MGKDIVRRALRLLLPLAAVLCILPGIFRPAAGPANPREFDALDLGGLPEYRARNGVLQVTLVARPQAVQLGGISFPGAAYNGIYAGPVLRAHAGDTIRIHLVNQMADSINLHFHGLRVTPQGQGDNMHISAPPGGSADYVFRIPPGHPPGLFWYHDHALHNAEPHVMAGLSGAFVIEGFAAQFATLGNTPQTLLVLKDWLQPDCTGAVLRARLHCHVLTINGGQDWTTRLSPGAPQLWRISSQSANLKIHLQAPGLHLRIIGRDGLAATSGTDVTAIDIMPASRLDVLAWADAPGDIPVIALQMPTGAGANFTTRRQIGHINAAGPGRIAAPSLHYPAPPDLRAAPPDITRAITFDENSAATFFTVNGRGFDPARVDLQVRLGTVEQWVVENRTSDFHEFHIHQLGFQVIRVNQTAQPFTGYVDDVDVPDHGSVTLLIPFTDPAIVGHFMFHCHVLKHEDRGMMATIEVLPPGLFRICRAPPG